MLLDADARAGHAERRRLLGLRRADHPGRHTGPERSGHRLLPLHPHRHRQRRQHDDSITTIVKVDTTAPAAPGLVLADSAPTSSPPAPLPSTAPPAAAPSTSPPSRPTGSPGSSTTASRSSPASPAPAPAPPAPTPWRRRPSPNGAKPVTARNQALLSSTATNFTLTSDAAGPTGGALTVNSVAASGGGTQSYDGDGAFTIGTRTDYTRRDLRPCDLDADARAGHAQRRRLLGLRRPDHARRHARPERSRDRLLPLRPHRHRQRRQHLDPITTVVKVDTSAPAAPGLVLADSSADVLHDRHDRLLPPRRQRLLRRHRLLDRRPVRDPRLLLPGPRRLHGSGAGATRTYTLATPTEPNGAKPVTARNQALARLERDELHAHLRRYCSDRRRADGQQCRRVRRWHAELRRRRRLHDRHPHRLHRRDLRSRVLDADARAGHAQRRRLLGLRRAHHSRRHSRPERSRHRLLPLRPHRHRQRRQHRLDHDRRQGRHDCPGRPDADAERHERRRLHHRHHRLLPPRRHRLLRRQRTVHATRSPGSSTTSSPCSPASRPPASARP